MDVYIIVAEATVGRTVYVKRSVMPATEWELAKVSGFEDTLKHRVREEVERLVPAGTPVAVSVHSAAWKDVS